MNLQTNILKRIYRITVRTTSSIQCRYYHSKKGVFGCNPSYECNNEFEVPAHIVEAQKEKSNLYRYVCAFRNYGHLKANTNPLHDNERNVPELNHALYGLKLDDSSSLKDIASFDGTTASIQEIEEKLRAIYCGNISAEFMHLPTLEEREWFAEAFETMHSSKFCISNEERVALATQMLKALVWDEFMAIKFQSVKRYGGEGAESLIGYFHETFQRLSEDGVEQIIIGIAHRGRLNFQNVLLDFPPVVMFKKMKGLSEFPDNPRATGDVLSHMVSSMDLKTRGEKPLHVTLLPNPSHLEAVNPVVCGKTRARQMYLNEGHYSSDVHSRPSDKVVGLQIHGDAALSGQGIVQETLAFSDVPHFNTGGTIHMCTNNQIGFTTPVTRARSSLYCTDVAKIGSFPVIHVNGDNPEEVLKAARLAVDYQRKFRRDVFVDLICWRRWGHNELDNPRFTNPDMYSVIDAKRNIPDVYASSLIEEGLLSESDVSRIRKEYYNYLNNELLSLQSSKAQATPLQRWLDKAQIPDAIETWDTGVDPTHLKYLGSKSVAYPKDFAIHPQVRKAHVDARLKKIASEQGINWATAEALAMASLLDQGFNVRLCGQDVGRGTFSQRHCMFVNQESSDIYIPLNHMKEDQSGFLEVANSILSEEAVLGFEYGFSIDNPSNLCIWEAQFGDFFNGAQLIIDTMVATGETKWNLQSGLVLLLPHGYDGAGPDHSTCHFERFLQNCDSNESTPDSESVNWNVVFPTTPAQYFHLLRRQIVRNYRKPLVIIGPKVLLRLPAAESTLAEMAPGTHFLPVIGDNEVKPDAVKKVIFVSGKHYYNLVLERKSRSINDTAIIRLEALCPFPTHFINQEIAKYKKGTSFVWAQEEPRNMGAWSFVNPRFSNLCGVKLSYAGRVVSAAPAVGIGEIHQREVQQIMDDAFSL